MSHATLRNILKLTGVTMNKVVLGLTIACLSFSAYAESIPNPFAGVTESVKSKDLHKLKLTPEIIASHQAYCSQFGMKDASDESGNSVLVTSGAKDAVLCQSIPGYVLTAKEKALSKLVKNSGGVYPAFPHNISGRFNKKQIDFMEKRIKKFVNKKSNSKVSYADWSLTVDPPSGTYPLGSNFSADANAYYNLPGNYRGSVGTKIPEDDNCQAVYSVNASGKDSLTWSVTCFASVGGSVRVTSAARLGPYQAQSSGTINQYQ